MEKKLKIKLETGTVYQNKAGGTYYFRYQINHERKCVSLKTRNQEEAVSKARNLNLIVNATSEEVIAAHVKTARNIALKYRTLPLSQIWEVYSVHPERATPETKREEIAYKASLNEFLKFVENKVKNVNDVSYAVALEFIEHLKTTKISVSTHNRKVKRLAKIFSTLQDYREEANPFKSSSLHRKEREEQGKTIRRLAFTREQEEQLRIELENPARRLINKVEIKVVYYIGMYTGQRLKDCVLMQWQNVDLTNKRISVKQFKTGKEVSIPIAEPLQKVLSEALDWKIDNYICPKLAKRYMQEDAQGKCVGDGLVNIDVLRVIKWIGLEPSVEVQGRKRKSTVYGFHSLRHSFASHCAEAGVPKAVVVSILGANSEIIDRFYTHVGEAAQRAAIDAISGVKTNTAQDKINEVLTFIDALEIKSTEVIQILEILNK